MALGTNFIMLMTSLASSLTMKKIVVLIPRNPLKEIVSFDWFCFII